MDSKTSKSTTAPKVNKKDLVKQIKLDLLRNHKSDEMTLSTINDVLDSTIDTIMGNLKMGRHVFWSGLGSFVLQKRRATMRRNPQNGKEINIPPKEVVKMKLFKSFADKCMVKTTKRKKTT